MVPFWTIDAAWLKANPQLARASRPNIDEGAVEMPNSGAIRQFIHKYEPHEKTYVDCCPGNSALSAPALVPAPAYVPAPALVPAPAPVLAPTLVPAPAFLAPPNLNPGPAFAQAPALTSPPAFAPILAPAPQYIAHPAPPSYYPQPALANQFEPPFEYGYDGANFLDMLHDIPPMEGFDQGFNEGFFESQNRKCLAFSRHWIYSPEIHSTSIYGLGRRRV
ncbi:hypothetical protein FRC12_017863 [Ceratobasidium sp. 428]|nr:hypothetical protein FRC12_017863 [Ceratobasidium sp. 428]